MTKKRQKLEFDWSAKISKLIFFRMVKINSAKKTIKTYFLVKLFRLEAYHGFESFGDFESFATSVFIGKCK